MRRPVSVLVLALLLLSLVPTQAESVGQQLDGKIVFTDVSHFSISLNMRVDYALIDGKNLSADEIRELLNSGDDRVGAALGEMAQGIFDDILASFDATGNISTDIIAENSGPVIVEMVGNASLSNSSCEEEMYTLLVDSGAEFRFTLEQLEIPALIELSPPEGLRINGMDSYVWDGGRHEISMSSTCRLPKNHMDILIDIYRIDTTGENQQVHVNLTLESEIYGIPYPYDIPGNRSISLEYAGIPLIRGMMSCGYFEEDEWNSTMDSILMDARELMTGEFPDITFSKSSWEEKENSVSMQITASASIPVSDLLSASSLFRRVITQNMGMRLYATEGFVTNYTILIPEGMLLDTVRISPKASYHRIFEDDRQGILVEIDDGNTRSMNMEIGVLVDLDPLIPLIFAVIVVTGMWFILLHTLPSRRRRH